MNYFLHTWTRELVVDSNQHKVEEIKEICVLLLTLSKHYRGEESLTIRDTMTKVPNSTICPPFNTCSPPLYILPFSLFKTKNIPHLIPPSAHLPLSNSAKIPIIGCVLVDPTK